MAQKILSVKLGEMDSEITKLHRRIQLCEEMSDSELEEEIKRMRQETVDCENTVIDSIKCSKADIPSELRVNVESLRDKQIDILKSLHCGEACDEDDCSLERRLLLAEYAMDFALLTSNHALLLALEAIAAQRRELD